MALDDKDGGPPPLPATFAPNGFRCTNYGGRGGQRQGRGRGCGHGPPAFNTGRAPPITYVMAGRVPGYMGPPPATGGGYYAPPPQALQVEAPPYPQALQVEAPLYSNLIKLYANWNAYYSCGFDVADGHTSQTCPQHLRKPDHNCYFTRQNAQQYINAGYRCSTKSHHKTVFPQM